MNVNPELLNCLAKSEQEELLQLLNDERLWEVRHDIKKYARYIVIPGAPVTDDDECEDFYPDNVTPAQHHDLLLDLLQQVADGLIPRLMILMPPGCAKSTYASVVFPTWYMGRFPHKNIIMTTYGSDLAKKFGRKCRQITRSLEYTTAMGTTLTGDNAAVDDWSLTNGSTYMCGGILSGITGNRADGLITDDPFKGREDADSETMRDKTREEYKSSLKTRLKPNAWEIMINTRWHELDLSGSILPDNYAGESGWITAKDGEQWYVFCLQAQCERDDDPLGRKVGDYLWTEWFTPEWWEQTKRTQSLPTARNWNALYQQRPAADEGDFFKREWFRYYDEVPKHLRYYGASDYAVTDGDGDYTVHILSGLDPDDNLYILDVWRAQTDSLVWVDVLISFFNDAKRPPAEWGEESGQILKSLDSFIKKRQREEKAYCYRKQMTSAADKPTRAQAIRGRMAQGKVYFPLNAPWRAAFETELVTFPNGRHDDQVDALSLLGRLLSEMVPGRIPPTPQKPRFELDLTFNELRDQQARRRRELDD